MTDTTSSDYPCNCRSCGTIISPSVTDMCEDCEIAAERNYEKFYTPMTDPDFVDIFDPDPDFVDIVTMLRGADRLEPYLCAAAADEIERLRKRLLAEENAYDIMRIENEHLQTDRNNLASSLKNLEHQVKCLEVELGRYHRMFVRAICKDLYCSGAKWKIVPNPMRDDGVFIREDCEPGKERTYFAFPHQFSQRDAEEIVFLLNRATDELKEKNNDR